MRDSYEPGQHLLTADWFHLYIRSNLLFLLNQKIPKFLLIILPEMEEISMKTTVTTITPLNFRNFHIWIREVQGLVIKANVWEYVNPDESEPKPKLGRRPHVSSYMIDEDTRTEESAATKAFRPAIDYDELSEVQQRSFQMKITTYKMDEKEVEKTSHGLRLMNAAIKASARAYIPPDKMAASIRDIITSLSSRYKRSDSQIIEQMNQHIQTLKTPPTRTRIKTWIADWKNVKNQIDQIGASVAFGSEEIFVDEFLKAGRTWASAFCDTWVRIKQNSFQSVNFFETTRQYRMTVNAVFTESRFQASRAQNNAASWQGKDQGQGHDQKNEAFRLDQTHRNSSQTDNRPHDEKHKEKECLCKKIHLFKNCPYMTTSARPTGFKEDKQVRANIRTKIQKSVVLFLTIRKFCNTNLLDGITEDSVKKAKTDQQRQQNQQFQQPAELGNENNLNPPKFTFANVTGNFRNPLHASVIYDSGCDNHLTFDRDRFVGGLREAPPNQWVDTPNGEMQVQGYEAMLMKSSLKKQPVNLIFEKTAYIPTSEVTLVSTNKLKQKGFIWDMYEDCILIKTTDQKMCEISKHFGLPTLEYKPVSPVSTLANSVQPRNKEKATPWTWHFRLSHCRPEVIDQLKKVDEVEVLKSDDAPKTVECTTCAISKMHQLGQRTPTSRATKPYEVLHFDLTILNKGFDGTSCIVHFTDEFTSFTWVYPLINHKEATLIPLFKSLINQCDRADLFISSVISMIRTGQKTSIGNHLENWVSEQGIKWNWSAKNTPQQNGTAERFGALLTEKIKCIRLHSKLPEDLYPECYLAAAHLLNRTPTRSLNWDSPLMKMQKLLNQPIKKEFSHLRVYGCKTYPLFKNADAPPKSEKMRPRAFINYLVEYDSTNIFRVWNPEKGDVNDYKNVIFNEAEFFDTYNKKDLIKKSEKADFVEFITLDPHPAFQPIDSDDEEWLARPIRSRAKQSPANEVDHPHQLMTPAETPEPENSQQISQPLPETGVAPLDVVNRPRSQIPSSNLKESHIIEGKRTRRPNPRYAAQHVFTPDTFTPDTFIPEEISKIPAFHAAFLAGTNRISEIPVHAKDLPPPPTNWRAMERHRHAKEFRRAANVEYSALETRGTWKIVDKSDCYAPILLKWVFTYKTDADGFLIKFKARLVVRGDLQEMDTQDVYAATLAFKVFRSLMALVAAFGLETRQLDAVNAFLNAPNDEEIYCFLPDDYRQPGKIMKMLRALYDQRKSPLLWLKTLSRKCMNLRLQQMPKKPCLFTNQNGVILFFYVDDIVVIYRSDQSNRVETYVQQLRNSFEIKDLGRLKFFLGVRILKNKNTISLIQNSYMEKLAKEYNIPTNRKAPASPLPWPADEMAVYENEIDEARIHEYRKKVGSICYSTISTRPDTAKAASKLAEHLKNPSPIHLQAANHCLHYLYATRYLGIEYSASERDAMNVQIDPQVFEATADASYANSPDRKSGEGYSFKLFGGLIDWAARKQLIVTTSTTETELLSMFHAGKELLWWMHLFRKLRFNVEHDLTLYNDNLQTLRILTSETPKTETKLRHINIAQCWLRQQVQNDQLNVDYLPTAQMVADGLTKMLPPQKHKNFIQQLNLVDLKKVIGRWGD